MSKRVHACSLMLASSLAAGGASAQAARTAVAPAPAAAAPTTPSAPSAATQEPALPTLDDPMLGPPPPPAHVVATWREALRILRSNSTTLKAARAQIEQARAQLRITRSAALPQLAAQGNVTDHLLTGEAPATTAIPDAPQIKYPNPSFYWTAALNLRVPVLASRTWYDTGTARDAVESAALSEKDIQRQQVAVLASSIVTVVTQERLAEVSRVSLASSLSTLDLTKRRAALGAASAVDVLRIEQEVSDSRAQVVSADEALRRSREALGDALGSPEQWGVTQEIRLDELANDAATVCTREAGVELRPDLRAAKASAHVAERNVKSVDYAYVPTVDAVSTLTYYSDPLIAPNREHVAWTIGGVLTWQLYDGGLRYGTRDARKADLTVAESHVADVRRRAILEITQTMRGVGVAQATLAVSQRSRDIASETARLTRIAYMNGTGTSFDLVDSARRLRAAELDYAIKEFQVLQAKITALLALATCNV